MPNDEESVKKALMSSSSVAVTSEDSANSNLATLMASAESLPGEVREPLSGGVSTPLSGGASTPLSGGVSTPLSGGASTSLSGRASTPSGVRANDEEPVEKALLASSSVAVTSEDANSNLAILMPPAESLPGEVREPLSRGASTPSGGRASPETARPSPALVPATAKTGAAIHHNRIHRHNVVTGRATAELTGAVTRYRGVNLNKNINNDDNNIINNNHAALAECFQPSTLHKLRQPGLYTSTDTPDGNNINRNSHVALAERFRSSTLHKLRQLGLSTDTDTPNTAHQLDAEAVSVEVAYTRNNTQPSCSGGGESDRVPSIFKEGMAGLRHLTS